MRKKLLFSFLVILFCASSLSAQQRTISGKVTSADDNEPLAGVSVKIKGFGTGVSTDSQGLFTIRASLGQTLVFSYIGFVTLEKVIGDQATFNIQMGGDAKSLDEVVVTAYGIERSQKSLGYDAQSIKGADIAQTQRGNFINSLQGRVAGVTITPTNGTPGASSQIIIRGAVSLDGDNQPLFVVDGLPISNNTFSEYGLVGQGTFNRQNDYGNRSMDINPDEIESVTILKGPEASAIYGTQGASGAVVITTKRAKAGKAAITYNNSFRADRAYRFPDIQKVYGGGAGGIFDEEIRTRTYFGARWPSNRQFYDNLGSFYQTGWTQRHNAAIEGGSEALSVRTAIGYENQNGVIPGTDYRTLNFKVTGTAKISDKISTNASVNMISSKTNKTYKGASSPMLSVLTWPIVDDIRNRYTETGDRRTITGAYNAELDNPIWAMENNPNSDQVSRILSNLGIAYSPTDWLNFRGTFGADIYTMQGFSGYHPQAYQSNVASSRYAGGGLNTFSEEKKLFNGSFVASAQKSFGKFRPALRLGYDFNDDRDQITAQFGSRFYQTNFFSLNNTDPTTQRVAYTDAIRRKMGFFGQAELGYNDLLFLTFTGRQDYSSTLPINNYSFFYPATSLSFVFSDLKPIKELGLFSQGKLRGSWGQSGKDARVPYITKNRLIAQGTTGGGFGVDVTLGNPDLVAEFTTSREVGFDLGFFKNRLTANFSYYYITSDGQITAPRLSYATGGILQYINSGKVENRGFELVINGNPIRKTNFSWDVTANITRVRGKITALPGDQETFYVSDTWLFDNVRRQYNVGSSVSSFSSFQYLLNNKGDILINPANGLPISNAVWTPVGDSAPDFGIGLINNFRYKNFNLSFLFDIRKGGDVYNATELYLYTRGMSTRTLDREIPRVINGVLRDGLENTDNPTRNNIVVTPYTNTAYYTSFNTNDFVEKNINWIRLKDITLTYTLPQAILAKSRFLKSAGVFFTGTDLWLLTNYKGVDPSVNGLSAASGGTGGTGIDFGSFGLPRGYNFGLKVGF